MGALSAIKNAAGKAAKGVGGAAKNAKNAFDKGLKGLAKDAIKKIPLALKIKICVFGGGFVVLLLLIQAILSNFAGESNDSVKLSSSKTKDKVLSGTLSNDEGGSKEQIEFAMELQEKYGSNIGFTLTQIKEMTSTGVAELGKGSGTDAFKSTYGKLTDSNVGASGMMLVNNVPKTQIKSIYDSYEKTGLLSDLDSLNETLEAAVWYYNYSNEGKMTASVITPYDKVSLYEHMLKTEKYNFNAITWRKYTHDNSGEDIERDKLHYDKGLGLLYPTEGGGNAKDFMSMTAPYILTSEIPRTFVASSAYSSNTSDSLGTSVVESYFDAESNKLNHHGDFAYEIIKHGLSDIIMNQYVLGNVTLNTYYEIYNTYSVADEVTFDVYYEKKEKMKDGKKVLDDEGNPEYEYVEKSNNSIGNVIYTSGVTKYQLEPNSYTPKHATNINTRINGEGKEDFMLEKEDTEAGYSIPGSEIKYKLGSARAFDVNVSLLYDYTKYEQEDVDKRVNESWKTETPVPLIRIPDSTNHIDEATIKSYKRLSDFNLANNFVDITTTGKPEDGCVTYKVKTKNYDLDYGNTMKVKRFYTDTIAAEPTSSVKKLLGVQDVITYNTNKKNDVSMSTVNASDFKKDTTTIEYLNQLSQKEKNAINSIDMLNTNPKVALNYMSSSQFNSTYLGYTRSSYAFAQGMSNIKKSFKSLAKENDNQLPWVYGASFGFDVNALPASKYGGGFGASGFSLLRDYIRSFEGTGPMSPDGTQYKVYADSGGVLTVGHGITIKNYGNQLMENGAANLVEGSYVDVEIADAVEDTIIRKFYENVKSDLQGREVTEYQMHALTCFAYNLGSIRSFNQYYDQFWNQERDDQFEEQDNNANYDHGLYKNFWSLYTHDAKGAELPGLVKRRKSEFRLFQTGYYDTIDKWYSPLSTGNVEGIDVYNSDGTVNEDKLVELQSAIEARLNLVQAPTSITSGSTKVGYSDRCAVTGNIYGSAGGDHNARGLQIYQCTWWANSRAGEYLNLQDPEKYPIGYPTASGNGGQYYDKNLEGGWFNYGPDPKPNSIGCGSSSSVYGHVYYVEAVDYVNGYYYISHAGGGEQWFGITKCKIGEGPWGDTCYGFIYLDEPLK